MDKLFLLQFFCCVIAAMLSMMLAWTRIQIRWLNKSYETSRWLLCLSMALLSFHYILQMFHGLRAHNDNVGAVVNILFYTPIACLISFSIYNVVCSKEKGRKRFLCVCASIYFIILAVFGVGAWLSDGLDIGSMLYVMTTLFVACLVYCIVVNIRAIRHHRRIMEENSGADMLPFDRYTGACYMMMAALALVLTAAILYRPLLLIFGPFMIFSLFVFTMSFIGYGYNMTPSYAMLEDMEEDSDDEYESDVEQLNTIGNPDVEKDCIDKSSEPILRDERINNVEKKLRLWCEMDGFRDSNANLMSISQKMNVTKEDLSYYFERYQKMTFRVWLSDIRFNAAKKMLSENPNFNNDTISAECGFSSHAHLYKIFKAKTGKTPRQWVESL